MKSTAVIVMVLLLSTAFAEEPCVDPITPLSTEDMKSLSEVMNRATPKAITTVEDDSDYTTFTLDASQFDFEKGNEIGMQMGFGGNPDIDGNFWRKQSWVIAVLYPVKETRIAGAPTTFYLEVRCHGLGEQPESANTKNLNVRCGPGAVADLKLTDWISSYVRVGSVTSRWSHNGAPLGQINPKNGTFFRDYPNDTWFTGAAMGAGVKVKIDKKTVVFSEYTKYYVQQTDNPAYQFRGGFTFGIARNFWLFQGKDD